MIIQRKMSWNAQKKIMTFQGISCHDFAKIPAATQEILGCFPEDPGTEQFLAQLPEQGMLCTSRNSDSRKEIPFEQR